MHSRNAVFGSSMHKTRWITGIDFCTLVFFSMICISKKINLILDFKTFNNYIKNACSKIDSGIQLISTQNILIKWVQPENRGCENHYS